MRKSNFGIAAMGMAAAFGLSACVIDISSDDSSSEKIVIKTYDDVFDLPTCDGKVNNGVEAFVTIKSGKDKYICRDEWMKQLDAGDEEPIYPDDYRTSLSMGLLPNGLVILGTQVWDSQNLNVSKFDGKEIGHCYEDEDENCDNFGRLYNWAEAMNLDEEYLHKKPSSTVVKKNHQGICPEGFHIPTRAEVDTLYRYVNKTRAAANYRQKNELGGWNGDDVQGVMLRSTNTNDEGINLWAEETDIVPAIDAFGMSFVASGVGYPETIYNDDGDSTGVKFNYEHLGLVASNWISNINDYELDADIFTFSHPDRFARNWESSNKRDIHAVRCIMNKSAAEYKLTSEYKEMLEEVLNDEDSEFHITITID